MDIRTNPQFDIFMFVELIVSIGRGASFAQTCIVSDSIHRIARVLFCAMLVSMKYLPVNALANPYCVCYIKENNIIQGVFL